MRVSLLALAVLLFPACTAAAVGDDPSAGDDSSDGTDMPTPDPGSDPDPGPGPGADQDGDDCPPDSLGTVDGLKDPTAFIDRMDPDDPESPAVRMLSGVAAPDVEFEIGLWDGYGAFAESPAAAGDFPITGDDADPDTCGICVELSMTVGEVEHRLVATGGTISIASVDGTLQGSGTTLVFQEVDGEAEFISGGCSSAITRVVFEAPLGEP